MSDESKSQRPAFGNGKICYVEMPAVDVKASANFYSKVFGWNIRQRDDGTVAFDDGVGQVSGTWITGRPPARTPGLLVYIMVDSVAATSDAIVAQGGEVEPCSQTDAPHIIATFQDPAGNVFGLYQEVGS